MKPPVNNDRFLHIFSPLLIAVTMFLLIRLSHDYPASDNYLNHTSLFIFSELVSIILGTYLSFYLTIRWNDLVMSKRVPVLIEYGAIIIVTLVLVILVMGLSHYIEDRTLTVKDIIGPGVVASLVGIWVYLWIKASTLDKKFQMTMLNNEKIRNEQLMTEMKLLQAQYHPHFLFNMLNTIYFRINEDNQEARDIVEHLSNLLRWQLYPGNDKVDLEREISVIESYIELSKLRFGDRLQLNVNIQNRSEGTKIYPYLLLPLVENAFKHIGGSYQIDINLMCDGKELVLEIKNSVGGNSDRNSSHVGIGMQNLKRRLELLYDKGSYSFKSSCDDNFYTAGLYLKL